MTEREFTRAVADATGEPRSLIRSRGFSLITADEPPEVDEPAHLGLSCPGCGAEVRLITADAGADALPEFAECGRCDAVYGYDEDEICVLEPLAVAACA